MAETERYVISILLQNESGALARVATMFAIRGFNIESLVVAPTEDESVSRLTLVTHCTERTMGQLSKQILKLIDVVALADRTSAEHLEREIGLLKFRVDRPAAKEMLEHIEHYEARVLDDELAHLTVEIAGEEASIDHFLENLPEGVRVLSVVRSGPLVIARGPSTLTDG